MIFINRALVVRVFTRAILNQIFYLEMRTHFITNDSQTTSSAGVSYKKDIKLSFYVILLFILITNSCIYDPPRPEIEICNKTEGNLTVELYFDKKNYKRWWSEHDFKVFLTNSHAHTHGDNGHLMNLISTDTVSLVQRYLLISGSSLSTDGWGDKDETILISKIKIIKDQDTMVYGNIAQIKKSFARINAYLNRLEIK